MTEEFSYTYMTIAQKVSDEEVKQYLHIPSGQIFYAFDVEDACTPWLGMDIGWTVDEFEEMPKSCRELDADYSHAKEALQTSITGMRVVTYPLNALDYLRYVKYV